MPFRWHLRTEHSIVCNDNVTGSPPTTYRLQPYECSSADPHHRRMGRHSRTAVGTDARRNRQGVGRVRRLPRSRRRPHHVPRRRTNRLPPIHCRILVPRQPVGHPRRPLRRLARRRVPPGTRRTDTQHGPPAHRTRPEDPRGARQTVAASPREGSRATHRGTVGEGHHPTVQTGPTVRADPPTGHGGGTSRCRLANRARPKHS